jgi:NADH-quinone oxidoreductase subunit C
LSDQERDAPGVPEAPAGGEPKAAGAPVGEQTAAAPSGEAKAPGEEGAAGSAAAAGEPGAAAGAPPKTAEPAATRESGAAAGAPGTPTAADSAPKPAAGKPPLSPDEKAALIAKAKAAKEAAAAGGAAGAGAPGAAPAAKPKPAHHEEDPNKPVWEKDPVAPVWEEAADDPVASALREEHGEAIESARRFAGDLVLKVRRDAVARVAASLKTRHGFTYLVDVCGADYPQRTPRFDVVYHLYSFAANRRVRLKVEADEATPVPSIAGVFRAANWPEREVYDMYGVRFEGHPDMTRILLWEGFNGYPLRKDFPVEGIDTGSAIYPEYYTESAGPVAGTGTGWKPPERRESGGGKAAG